ncbi:hypothetical protein DPX16_19950 [Anabarilius grahami]|uniref:Uncharacterized protein n=1 Tax=Anabarilius grahami TaxID=495550 RepID=A0A3N0YGM4_ANAGA|nr:hypothetical protein DPX16_19950 [Anabarilius grahami]
MDDALKNQEHHPQTELQGWAKKSGSTLVVMLVPSGTPGTGRTNARREKRSDVVTDRTVVLETAEIQRQSQNPPRDTTEPPPPLSVGKLKQSSDTMTDRWESRNTLMNTTSPNPSIQVVHASIHPCAHGPHQTRPQPFWDAHEAGVDGADLEWVSYVCEADGSNSCGIERLASGARLPARQGHSRLPRLRAARCHHRPP